ncbi:hypothetical protein Tco_0764037, partial [Tanacetum coccineum]
MNYIPVRKENYANSGGKGSTYDEVDALDDQQFIVHVPSINATQNKLSEEHTTDKEVPLSSEEQALHDELVSLMHQESLAKSHNDAQRNAFEEEKRRIALEKGKECVNSTFTLSTANTPSQSTGNTPTDISDKRFQMWCFLYKILDDETHDNEEDGEPDSNNMDHTIDVSSTPTLRIHKNHPQSQIIGKSTAGVVTRRKLKEGASDQHQALLSFIYKQNRTNHKDQQTCLFACFLSQEEPKKVSQAKQQKVGLKRCKRNYFNSSYKMYGYYMTYQMAREPAHNVCCMSLCGKFQVHSKGLSQHAVKSDYAGTIMKRSTHEDVNIVGRILEPLAMQRKQTIVANYIYRAEYVSSSKLLCQSYKSRHHGNNWDEHSNQLWILLVQTASSPRDAQGTPTQSAAQDSSLQGTADFQGTAATQGDEGLLDLYALNREVRRLKKQTISQAKQIRKLKTKLKKLSKRVQPVVKHHAFWVESQNLKKQKRQRQKQRKKVSSVKLGRNKDESNLSEENNDQDDHTAFVTPDLERKSDETEEVIIEEKDTSDVKSGDTEELDLEKIQSTARQSTVTPRTLNFDDEAGPSSPIRPTQEEEPEEQFKDDELLADILLNRTRGLSIPGPMQSQPQQPTQATDPKEKGKGILVEEPKKKKLTLQQIRALETKNDEEVARKIQAEWDAEEERKRLEALKKPKTILKKPTSLVQERNQMMSFLKGQGYKNLQKLKYPQMKELYDKVQESIKDSFKDFIPMGSEKEKQMLQERDAKRLLRKRKATITEEQPSKKLKLRTETIDELRNYLRIVDFEQSAQDRESL